MSEWMVIEGCIVRWASKGKENLLLEQAVVIINEHASLTEKVERLLDGIKRARQIVYSLDCECDEAEGYTCTIHDDRKLFDALLESE